MTAGSSDSDSDSDSDPVSDSESEAAIVVVGDDVSSATVVVAGLASLFFSSLDGVATRITTTTTAAIIIAAIGPHLLAAVAREDFSCAGSMIPLFLNYFKILIGLLLTNLFLSKRIRQLGASIPLQGHLLRLRPLDLKQSFDQPQSEAARCHVR